MEKYTRDKIYSTLAIIPTIKLIGIGIVAQINNANSPALLILASVLFCYLLLLGLFFVKNLK